MIKSIHLMIKIFGVLLLIVFLLFGMLWVMATQIDPNDFKDEMTVHIEQYGPHRVSLGHLSWSFFPWLGIKLDDSALYLDGEPDHPLMTLEQLDIRIKLLSLFKGKPEIGRISVIAPRIRYHVDANGQDNWQLHTLQGTTPDSSANKTQPDGSSSAPAATALLLQHFEIQRAEIDYQVAGDTPTHWHLQDLSLSLLNFDWQQPSPLTLQGRIQQLDALGQPLLDLDIQLATDITLDSEGQELSLNPFSFAIGDLQITGPVSVSQLTEAPSLAAKLQLLPVNMNQWLVNSLQIDTGLPASALQSLQADFTLNADQQHISVDPLSIQLDSSQIQGYLKVTSIEQQQLDIQLSIDQLNLDDYMPPSVEQETEAETPSASSENIELLPVALLASLNQTSRIAIDEVMYQGLSAEKVLMMSQAKQGVLTVNPFSMQFLSGQVIAEATIDVRNPTPQMAVKKSLKALQIDTLMDSILEKEMLGGVVNFEGEFTTTGNTIESFKKNLVGQAELQVNDGLIKGINLTQMVQQKVAELQPLLALLLPEKATDKLPSTFKKDTHIVNMAASISVNNGIVNTQQLSAHLEAAKLNGHGQWQLSNNSGNFNLDLQLNESASNPYLAQLTWPMHCGISETQDISCGVDLKPIRQQLQDELEKKTKQEAKQKLNSTLNDALGLEGDQTTEQHLKEQLKAEQEELLKKAEDKLSEELRKLF